MFRKLSVSAVALSLLAAPAMAQSVTYLDGDDTDGDANNADVVIDIQVQEIAELEVTEQSATMVVDTPGDAGFMSNPSSSNFNDFSNVAKLELRSNFDVDAIRVDFLRTNGIKNFSTTEYFGKAECVSGTCSTSGGTTVLGVFPAISQLDGSGNFINGGGVQQFYDGSNTAIVYDGDAGAPSPGFPAGVTGFGLGVATNWDRTLVGEPTYAEPGTYSITLEATLVPTL